MAFMPTNDDDKFDAFNLVPPDGPNSGFVLFINNDTQ